MHNVLNICKSKVYILLVDVKTLPLFIKNYNLNIKRNL